LAVWSVLNDHVTVSEFNNVVFEMLKAEERAPICAPFDKTANLSEKGMRSLMWSVNKTDNNRVPDAVRNMINNARISLIRVGFTGLQSKTNSSIIDRRVGLIHPPCSLDRRKLSAILTSPSLISLLKDEDGDDDDENEVENRAAILSNSSANFENDDENDKLSGLIYGCEHF
jgi:hypothetical protein